MLYVYIHSVSLKNYKSIGEKKNTIILEPNVTAIIGKNESGKSNVLEGLSNISLLGNMEKAFNADNINRNNVTNANIEYIIVLKPILEEQKLLNIHGDTQIVIDKDSYEVTGSFLTYYDEHIRESAKTLISVLEENPFQLNGQDNSNYLAYIASLQQKDSLHLRKINESFDFFKARLSRVKEENRDLVSVTLEDTKLKWEKLSSTLPTVFYRNADKVLKTQYKLEEVQKELANPVSYPNSLLADFVNLIEIPKDDFITAVRAVTNGIKTSIRKNINNNVNSKFNEKFKQFYTVENLSLSVDFDSNIVSFSVRSNDGETLMLSERSNGLRWYFNTFIDAAQHEVSTKNAVYLFDEPGTSLHVNAQKELLKLFHDLADKENQVVYTTHAPYMLDMKDGGIHRIRAVDKDKNGYTYIYKTAYDLQLSPDNQEDTLAPIINAIGMNFSYAIGPSNGKLNIVTEGVSDYIYIYTMAKQLGYDLNKYAFIPSVGASNCINICNILYGWGCPFFAVFDYDKEGVTKGGEIFRKKFTYEFNEKYCYVKPVTQEDVDNQTYKNRPYVIEDVVTTDELDKFIKEKHIKKDIDKSLKAKFFSNAVEDKSYAFGEQCKENFKNLLDRITKTYH